MFVLSFQQGRYRQSTAVVLSICACKPGHNLCAMCIKVASGAFSALMYYSGGGLLGRLVASPPSIAVPMYMILTFIFT